MRYSRTRIIFIFFLAAIFLLRFLLSREPNQPEPFDKLRMTKGNELSFVRDIALRRLDSLFPEPSASFAKGLLFGASVKLPESLREDFRKAGLTHIFALSGYNVIVILSALEILFVVISRHKWTILSIDILILFIVVVGGSASIVRAVIMGSLNLIAKCLGRPSPGFWGLLLAGFVMIIVQPRLLFHDIGFQLSFAASAGIIFFASRISRFFERFINKNMLVEIASSTIAAQILTLPILVIYFQGFSLISLFANIIVLPIIPWLMLGSFLSLFLGVIAAGPAYLLFSFVLAIIHWFAGIPFAFVEIGIS